jgi:hypothetical protein
MPADQTQPQMNPMITHFQAFFTAFGVRFNVLNLIGMSTFHADTLARRQALLKRMDRGIQYVPDFRKIVP